MQIVGFSMDTKGAAEEDVGGGKWNQQVSYPIYRESRDRECFAQQKLSLV